MKTITLLLLTLLIFARAQSQDTWYDQTSGLNHPLTGICFTDSQTGWICGWTGNILHTTDGGMHWALQDAPPSDTYSDIWFSDTLHGWSCGDGGFMVHTNNGGMSWTIQNTPSYDDLYSVFFLDSMNGWAVGGNYHSYITLFDTRTVFHTADGGNTWTYQYGAAYEQPLKSVQAIDENTIYVTGDDGLFMHSSNGGTDWQFDTINPIFQFHHLYFLNADTGWVSGESLGLPHYGAVYKTTDAGQTWTEEAMGEMEVISSVQFLDADNGWACGDDWGNDNSGIMYRTSDGGQNWTYETLPDNTEGLNDLFFTDMDHGWTVGYLGSILSTANNQTDGVAENVDGALSAPVSGLEGSFPNPFVSQTTIQFKVGSTEKVLINIYSLDGKLVRVLADKKMQAGNYSLNWDGNTESGAKAAPGIYLCSMQAGHDLQTKRICKLR